MKRVLSSLLALLIILTAIPTVGFGTSRDEPNLVMVNPNTVIGEPGDIVSIPLEIKNTGRGSAEDITAVLSADSTGMVYVDGSAYKNLGRLSGGRTNSFDIDVKIDERAESKTYTMNLSVVYYSRATSETQTVKDKDGNETYVDVEIAAKKYELSGTVNVRVSGGDKTPEVTVSRVDIMPAATVRAGNNVVVGFELENTGDSPARNIKVALKGLSNEGFSLQTGVSSKTIPVIESGRKDYIFFELKSSKRMAQGNHEMEVEISYRDEKRNEITDKSSYYIGIASNDDRASQLLIQNLTYPTGNFGANKEFNISFDVKNQGQTTAKKIVIKVNAKDGGVVPKSLSTMIVDSLEPGSTVQANFTMLTTKASETQNYPIEITVDYTDDLLGTGENRDQLYQLIGAFVVAPAEKEDGNLSTPKLIIDKYNFEPQLVEAGQNFVMNLSFYNTNNKKAVKNIKIFLTSDEKTDPNSNSAGGSVFTPVDSSNTFYIDNIPPNGRVEKRITMFTVPDAVAKTYTLTANFEYEDAEANKFDAIELIGVPVIQKSKLDLGEISDMPEAFIGQSTPISLEFFNTGKVTLYNMMVKLEGDFQTENAQLYVGNFASGTSEYFEGYVIPNAPGTLEGELVFTYEDSTGQEQEIREPFSLNVMDMPMEPEFPGGEYPLPEEPSGGNKTKLFIGGGIAIVAAAAGVIIFKKRKNKKAEAMEIDE